MNNWKYRVLIALILIIVSTGCGGTSSDPDKGPNVGPIQGSPSANIEAGSTIPLAVNASGDNIRFLWEATAGDFTSEVTKSSVTYMAPMQAGSVTITVTVIDRNGLSNTQNLSLTIVSKPTQTPEPTLTPTPISTQTPEQTLTPTSEPTLPPPPSPTPIEAFIILKEDGKLADGLDMGVNSSSGRTAWATTQRGEICMAYPSGQTWGAVFITVGKPTNTNRPGRDFSAYRLLSFEIKGKSGAEYVLVGVKDNKDGDSGEETKKLVDNLTTNYQTVELPLSGFTTADLQNVYVVIEFVFEQTPYTICVKNIQYLP